VPPLPGIVAEVAPRLYDVGVVGVSTLSAAGSWPSPQSQLSKPPQLPARAIWRGLTRQGRVGDAALATYVAEGYDVNMGMFEDNLAVLLAIIALVVAGAVVLALVEWWGRFGD